MRQRQRPKKPLQTPEELNLLRVADESCRRLLEYISSQA